MTTKKDSDQYVKPSVNEVAVAEDTTSNDCQGKKLGCYAGSTCASTKKKLEEEAAKKGNSEFAKPEEPKTGQ